jgi:hypothetical protein
VRLHVAGITNIETAAQAADALRPLAGAVAFPLFALGVLGGRIVGVPRARGHRRRRALRSHGLALSRQ